MTALRVSAILLILIFPRFNLTWLAPVALTPILIACAMEGSWKRRFRNGWLAGFVFWFGVCYWIQFVLEVHGGLGRWGGWGTFTLFAVLKGLHLAIFAALAGFLMPRPWAIPAVAALWSGIERTHGPLGFTWLQLGNAGIGMPLLCEPRHSWESMAFLSCSRCLRAGSRCCSCDAPGATWHGCWCCRCYCFCPLRPLPIEDLSEH